MNLETVLEIQARIGGMSHYDTVAINTVELFELCEVARKALISPQPEVEEIEITSAMEEAGMREVKYQYNLPSTRAGVVAVFRAMWEARPLAQRDTQGDR